MTALIYTVAFEGVDARIVEVQCAVSPGIPGFAIVGLPDKAVSEARERIRAALAAMSIALPSRKHLDRCRASLYRTIHHFPRHGRRSRKPENQPRHGRGQRSGTRQAQP